MTDHFNTACNAEVGKQTRPPAYVVPAGMTPEKLRLIAGWLDVYDRLTQAHVELCALMDQSLSVNTKRAALDVAEKKEVQIALRRWADQLEAS